MGRILKWLIYLALVGFVALVTYAYIGPFVGADFSAEKSEVRIPVSLDLE